MSFRFFRISSARSCTVRLFPLVGIRGSDLGFLVGSGLLKLGFGVVGTGGLNEAEPGEAVLGGVAVARNGELRTEFTSDFRDVVSSSSLSVRDMSMDNSSS